MKNRSWLNIAESLMLLGSGVGSIATVASQQVLYTAAPVSALLILNVLNHRRIEKESQSQTSNAIAELDQRLSGSLSTLQQQIQTLPSPLHLANLRKDLQNKNQEIFNDLNQKVQQLQQEIAKPGWRTLPNEVNRLREQYSALANSVAGVRESLSRLDTIGKVEAVEAEIQTLKEEIAQLRTHPQTAASDQNLHHYRVLQDQINHLNRRLNKLPAPFDASTLKQEVDSLIKVLSDMVSRRDLARVEAQLERLTKQESELEQTVVPLKIASGILKKQLDTLAGKLAAVEITTPWLTSNSAPHLESEAIAVLKVTVNSLEERLAQVAHTSDLANLRDEFQTLVATHLRPLQQQLEDVQQQTQDLERQQKTLGEWVHHIPQLLDSGALQNEIKYLATRVEWAENTVVDLQTKVESVQRSQTDYELVFDVKTGDRGSGGRDQISQMPGQQSKLKTQSSLSSRSLLEQALQNAQARLVVVYPFPDPTILDAAMFEQFRQFLSRRGCLDMGWGYLGEGPTLNLSPWENRSVPRAMSHRRMINPTDTPFLFNTLNQLTELKKQYPEQFRFKILGTDENFLVCDRAYAILGSQSIATASVVFPTAAVGLRITNPEVIQRLMERFDHPVLSADDAIAYFNRATSRYDLGDREGAIADYTQVLKTYPDDDVTYNNRGLARYDLGDKAGAIADFEAAIQHHPHSYMAYCNRGVVRSELGDKLAAIEDYTHAIQLQPDYAPPYFYRGLARTRMQNRSGAIQDYSEVIRLQPDDAAAYLYRGLAYAKLGQSTDAIQDLQQAAQLFSEQGDTANYQQSLNALNKLQQTLVSMGSGQSLANESSVAE